MPPDDPSQDEPDGEQLQATRTDAESDVVDDLAAELSGASETGAESFVELEADLVAEGADPGAARVLDARTVPLGDVPPDYPRDVEGEEALVLELALESGDTVDAYFGWPPPADGPLDRLLEALELSRESFANLNGRRLLVHREDEYVLPVVPESRPRGSPYGYEGILAGQAANLGLLAAAATGAISLPPLLLGLLVLHLVVLPVATFLDGWHLRTTTDWNQGPSFWAVLQSIPGLNLLVTAAYLWLRRDVQPLGEA